jgi:hypothetical protein
MKNISTAQEFAGASIFSVNVVTKIDAGSADGSEGCIGIFKCPPHLSRAQFHEFVNNKVSNGFVALPTVQKNIVKGEMVCSSLPISSTRHMTEKKYSVDPRRYHRKGRAGDRYPRRRDRRRSHSSSCKASSVVFRIWD